MMNISIKEILLEIWKRSTILILIVVAFGPLIVALVIIGTGIRLGNMWLILSSLYFMCLIACSCNSYKMRVLDWFYQRCSRREDSEHITTISGGNSSANNDQSHSTNDSSRSEELPPSYSIAIAAVDDQPPPSYSSVIAKLHPPEDNIFSIQEELPPAYVIQPTSDDSLHEQDLHITIDSDYFDPSNNDKFDEVV